MTEMNRRALLQAMGAGALASALPASIARAAAIPAASVTGTIADVQHIVILTQENRSFDHYFGSMVGVRGFNDPRAVTLPGGGSVWQQPDGAGGMVMPFHPDAPNLGMAFLSDVSHGWTDSHGAWNNGNYDQWVPYKGSTAMTYYTRQDISYHYALADAFTVCDAYHCSLMGPTDPNRYHMWTGWCGNDGKGGGPVIDNSEAGYAWSTYPERLRDAGITWKVYQDAGVGLTADGYWGWTGNAYIGNYGDNSLLYFFQYQNAKDTGALAKGARTGTNISVSGTLFDQFRADVLNGTLPQVSYITPPEAYSEHPNFPPDFGAWYISQILDALTANPAVWAKTVLLINYDEAGGFFDHMVPPTPPASDAQGRSTVSTHNEIYPGNGYYAAGPYGFGTRVPMLVISPWSKGGYVNSQLFDHTSIIRFIEARFAASNPILIEKNITKWRRAIAGDLTTAFNFANPDAAVVALPSTATYQPQDQNRYPDYIPLVPVSQTMPVQETGVRPARALPYQPLVHGVPNFGTSSFTLHFGNTGPQAIAYQVRSQTVAGGPWMYTVSQGKSVKATFDLSSLPGGKFDFTAYGPNGFMRAYRGATTHPHARINVIETPDAASNTLGLKLVNFGQGGPAITVTIANGYTGTQQTYTLAAGESVTLSYDLNSHYGWYDLTLTSATDPMFRTQLAGHLENGQDSISDPMMGGVTL